MGERIKRPTNQPQQKGSSLNRPRKPLSSPYYSDPYRHPIAGLANRLGNQGMIRYLEQLKAQASQKAAITSGTVAALPISKPGDAAEREADAMADLVLSSASAPGPTATSVGPTVERHATSESEIRSVSVSPTVSSLGAGRSLDPETRSYFEPRFGFDFSKVRLHADGESHRAATALNARAFTVGQHIAFAKGQHAPRTEEGRRLLAHELAHVVQQHAGVASRIQCQLFEEVTPSTEAPGLSERVVRLAHEAIARGDKQEAIDVVVDEMARTGQIDRAKLLGGRVHYKPGLPGEGATTRRGFRHDVATGLTALRRSIRVGDDAFRNVPWLYSSILHEYQHVLQTERPSGLPTVESVVPGQQSARVHRMQRDVEAYAMEILHAHETGVDRHPFDVRDLWERLHDAWSILSDAQKDPLKDLYRRVHARAESIPGVGALGHFTPLP